MKKLIFVLFIILRACSNDPVFAQFQYMDIGQTRIKDSTGYETHNRSVLLNHNLFVKGFITLDSLGKGRIEYNGFDMVFTNEKAYGGYTLYTGTKDSKIFIKKLTEIFPGYLDIAMIDSTGIDLTSGLTYKINGVSIVAGLTNLYGYGYKDSANVWTQHNKFKSFSLYLSGSDSVQFLVKGSSGDLRITPVGSNVTFGSSYGIGSKNVYAGAYFIADTNLIAKTISWTGIHTFQQTLNTVTTIPAAHIDCRLGNNFVKTLASNETFDFTNMLDGQIVNVALDNGGGSFTVAWTGVTWSGGTPPTQSSGLDIYTFIQIAGTIYGTYIQNY